MYIFIYIYVYLYIYIFIYIYIIYIYNGSLRFQSHHSIPFGGHTNRSPYIPTLLGQFSFPSFVGHRQWGLLPSTTTGSMTKG